MGYGMSLLSGAHLLNPQRGLALTQLELGMTILYGYILASFNGILTQKGLLWLFADGLVEITKFTGSTLFNIL